MVPPSPEALKSQLACVQHQAHYCMLFHATRASLGRRSRYWYGLLAALLAAAAGTTALLKSAPGLTAFLAFASPVVASLQQLARPESRASEHHKLRAQYESIDRRAQVFLATRFDPDNTKDALTCLDGFVDELNELLIGTSGDLWMPGPDQGIVKLLWRKVRNRPLVQASDDPLACEFAPHAGPTKLAGSTQGTSSSDAADATPTASGGGGDTGRLE